MPSLDPISRTTSFIAIPVYSPGSSVSKGVSILDPASFDDSSSRLPFLASGGYSRRTASNSLALLPRDGWRVRSLVVVAMSVQSWATSLGFLCRDDLTDPGVPRANGPIVSFVGNSLPSEVSTTSSPLGSALKTTCVSLPGQSDRAVPSL